MTLRHHPLYLQWLLRRRRLRKLLRPLPRRANVARYPVIKWFAEHARRAPYLWSFKRAQVIPALYVGSVLAFLPLVSVQFLLAFGAAMLIRGNITLLIGLQMITNPVTIAPIYAFTAWVGYVLMDALGLGRDLSEALRLTQALFIGGAVVGVGFGLLADLTWRFLAWESRVFRAKLAALRAHHAAADTKPPESE